MKCQAVEKSESFTSIELKQKTPEKRPPEFFLKLSSRQVKQGCDGFSAQTKRKDVLLLPDTFAISYSATYSEYHQFAFRS